MNKRDEARLHAFEVASRLAAIVESSDDAIIGKTLTGVITSWNAGAERLYGYSADEIVGHSVSELFPADRVGELERILEGVSRGDTVRHYATQRVCKDGRVLEMSVAVSAIRDSSGAVTGASAVGRDMTEIIRADVYRRELEAQLHHAQRLESLGQLAGGVAHDFNNLLAGIMNYSGLVSSVLHEEMDQHGLADDQALTGVLDDVEQITKAAQRAAALTRQLLIFSRREVLHPQAVDLNAVIGEMEDLLRTTIGQNVNLLRLVLARDLPLVTIDRGLIEQVIMNLVVNARDAMPYGGPLEIETSMFESDEVLSHLHGLEPGMYVRLSVSDTGIGMSKETAGRAFEPFFTTKPLGEGTGLGLATAFGIVSQAGGALAIHSEPGFGTTVRVFLPVAVESEPAPGDTMRRPQSASQGETVLLVGDEEIVRVPARRILSRSGYAVIEASNATDALEISRRHPAGIDLLLTDVVMPGTSGKELAANVLAQRPAIKVLFMSGYSESVIVHHGVIDEGVNLIEKPFSGEELLRRVRGVLDGGS